MASASTGAEPKSSSASRGLSTIGRPAVLRLVLTTTGMSVSSLERCQQARRQGVVGGVDGLDPGRAVHVGDSLQPLLPGGGDVVHEEHVRAGDGSASEDLGRPVGQHHRRHWPELLASLDVVEPLGVVPRGPGWASSDRWPSARGPYSARPWNQATIPSSAMISAAAPAMSAGRW